MLKHFSIAFLFITSFIFSNASFADGDASPNSSLTNQAIELQPSDLMHITKHSQISGVKSSDVTLIRYFGKQDKICPKINYYPARMIYNPSAKNQMLLNRIIGQSASGYLVVTHGDSSNPDKIYGSFIPCKELSKQNISDTVHRMQDIKN